ncbi:hypothetical protein VM1G_04646 [Cytospora mali]|uniref:Heterokaryon incompatibility domain-containing protein n=1 Tax=Cytospora mali TaxID=578113 RepID=A0A194VW08_CYTMA|nr:hypothetical protein VM1G_04646 [Valsa mali]
MTSYERSGKGTYGTVEFPKYSILSYTWGRWQTQNLDPDRDTRDEASSRALPVSGTTWAIPSVNEDHFTVEAFQKVVFQIGHSSLGHEEIIEWAWIDVACIDQEDDAVKMDEVGRQVSIFRNASRAYVWLSRIPRDALEYAMYILRRTGGDFSLNPWNQEADILLPVLRVIRQSIVTVLDDPWFSSLWTLQELMMRHDAVILSREAMSVPITGYAGQDPVDLNFLMQCCVNVQKEVARKAVGEYQIQSADLPSEVRDLLSDIENRIYCSGVPFALLTSNPNVQYGAAKFRQTSRTEDRIYGIMQIYDLRVGQSIRTNEKPTLDELVKEFGLAINGRSPVMGQLFVHIAEPRAGLSWCISEESGVPDWLHTLTEPQERCTISLREGGPTDTPVVVATGPCCTFSEFYGASTTAGSEAMLEIFLDHTTNQLLGGPASSDMSFRRRGLRRDPDTWQQRGAALLERFGSEGLVVMLLGESRLPMPRLNSTWGQYYGVLLRRVDAPPGFPAAYQRLGLICWRDLILPSPSDEGSKRFSEGLEVLRTGEDARLVYLETLDKLFSGPSEDLVVV